MTTAPLLPARFREWFASRGWAPRRHQIELLAKARDGRSTLLVAPTGAGKTLAGFLPSLVDLAETGPAPLKGRGLHTLYISPLKALAIDVARNVETPVREMELPIRIESRTGDTPAAKRKRQVERPPDILMTTPEQLALMLASPSASELFGGLKRVVLDELHALVTSKRGDLLSLDLARLRAIAPTFAATGLSATVREPDALRRYLVGQGRGAPALADLVVVEGGAEPDIRILDLGHDLPLAGHLGPSAMPAIYGLIREHKTTLVFTNTRFQAEYTFQELWRLNDDVLPIAIHHGSLDVEQRRRVEAAMTAGKLKAVVCTATLDLGIDWGDVDLVVNVGAPKGASRIMQRIGRANHRMEEPSKAYLAPTNRFEILECQAALDAIAVAAQDTPDPRTGALDVLAQHVLGRACAEPFALEELYDEVRQAAPYADLSWEDFGAVVDFVATGGYALRAYERFAKIVRGADGRWRVRDGRVAQQYRMNVGTITEATMLKVRLSRSSPGKAGAVAPRRGRILGEVEEGFVEAMSPGDTFIFAGEILRFEAIQEDEALVTRATAGTDPKIPAYAGAKFPLSTFLAARVRGILAEPAEWHRLPMGAGEWLEQQRRRSLIPAPGEMLVETFPRQRRHYLVAFPFEGRLAHQTLGMLLTRRLERARLRPLGFVANDYGIATWCMGDVGEMAEREPGFLDTLFGEDMLGDDLEEWLAESAMMKRTFRDCAVIAGLIERNHPGERKTRRQVTVSTDLVYDVLRRHEPDHILLRAARADAATGLLDVKRLGAMLVRIRGRIRHKALDRVSPLAISLILEIGRESVIGEAADEILAEAEAMLLEEALA
ncbi:ligase-associated DNA damage response DEXH box helicase [Enterovirga aerilata]|uniref:Ligase-associated DNA damage response DEXH box helicase n=1 Tax=Enterovirga aerilata TaxID=2730920 RepID=A0A849I045_9HYPH|nr:ligase-associated DNA damage response DEXH box helicase [Enterovirga sp. DB1703]NNM70924.1 ligase-associated DNA damage response DEXH box helicase [Enterovirga sp. DB1703]